MFLGLVNVIAELLILDVELFGYKVEFHPDCRNIRKNIGNGLINLTFQHKECKKKLCTHKSFIKHVTRIISEASSLSQVLYFFDFKNFNRYFLL